MSKGILKSVGQFADHHSPEILLGFGIAGMVTTAVLSARATAKAAKAVNEEKKYLGVCYERGDVKLSPKEVLKLTWKYYIPAALTGGVSIAFLIGSNSVNNKRTAALATAYAISESALKRYTEKVVETIGEKKELAVREKVGKEIVEEHPVSSSEVIVTDKGNTLCFDSVSGRYFNSDMDKIQRSVNEINRRLRSEMYISLNEFYCEIGLPPVKLGDILGWNIDKDYLDVKFNSQIAEDGRPALVLVYSVVPKYDYR